MEKYILSQHPKLNPVLTSNKVYIVDSIKSGTGRADDNLYSKIIKPLFQLLKIGYEYYATTSAASIVEFARSLSKIEEDLTIIFISGDTSINEFINGLPEAKANQNITVFPIPGGTGNSLALSVNLTSQIEAVAKLVTSSNQPAPLYLYEVDFPTGSYHLVQDEKKDEIQGKLKFLVVVSWGFHASLVADSDTPELRKFGLQRFQIAAMNNLKQEQKYEGDCYINNRKISGPFAYWLVTSSQRFEPTFEISPKGNIFEESLYLVTFNTQEDKEGNGDYIMKVMKDVYNKGAHAEDPNVTYEKLKQGDEITLKTTNTEPIRNRRFCVDGSIIALPEQDRHEIKIAISNNVHKNWNLYILH
ncbi:sphingosine kinase-like protein [Spathaspora passalidarum NRRL Y-27907]|uniref:Sphingosine kinase-like protein n=1 Tax=Spathaspora passalidarum (strain NRRL Y-27907 / 11-Y1) TaxID=619300 RepID=G3ASV8_SPAPN|nr:sphingosine kinase-like protein [Spathaspora passalidarum NRRL Y-27907]EGW30741.1 sphingosine kinase-like protein [Spathaspora passalidarum NRRL Y-27907]